MKPTTAFLLSIPIIAVSGYLAFKKIHGKVASSHSTLPIETFQTPDSTAAESDVVYQLLVGELALSREMPEAALKHYLIASKLTQDPKIAERATRLALTYGTEEEAIAPALIWAKGSSNELEAQMVAAGLMLIKQSPEKATPYLAQILKSNPQEADSDFITLYKQLNSPKAQESMIRALMNMNQQMNEQITLQKSNTSITLKLALAEIYLTQDQAQKAFNYTSSLISFPHIPSRTYILHAQALYQLGQSNKAEEFLKGEVAKLPNDVILRMYYTELLLERGNKDLAHQQLKYLENIKDIPVLRLLQLARLSMEVEWYQDAETFFLRAESDEKEGDNARYFLGRINEAQKNIEKALEWYSKVNKGSFHVVAHIRAAGILEEAKQYDKAIAMIEEANPESFDDYKRIILAESDILTQAERTNDVYELLTKALIDLPQDNDILYARALTATRLNNIAKAEEDLKLILKTNPNHIDALNALGYILTDNTERYDEAYTYLTKAIGLNPTNPSIMDSLGWLYYKKGDLQESLKWLQQAIKLQPDADTFAHLGEVLWKAGKPDAAEQLWTDALKKYPDNVMIRKTVQRFHPKTVNNQATH